MRRRVTIRRLCTLLVTVATISSALANGRSCSRTYATVADAVPEV